jgi:hypothetical protein
VILARAFLQHQQDTDENIDILIELFLEELTETAMN